LFLKEERRERVRSEQEEDKEEAFWKMDGALYTTAGWRKREKKRNLSRRNPPRTGLSRTAPRAEKTRNTHLASRFMRLHSHPSFAPIAFSFLSLFLTPIKNSRFAHQKSHHHHRQNERRRERRDAKRETPPHLS